MDVSVSVIIPIFNAEMYLEECLDSVRAQKGLQYEIICVDDASTDGSAKMLTALALADSRISVIALSKNHGQAYARNRGIDEAKGQYIYFIDSDDVMLRDDALLRLYGEAEMRGADCVCFDSEIVYENEGLKPLLNYRNLLFEKIRPGTYEGQRYFDEFFMNADYSVAVWRQFWRKRYLIENGLGFCEDTSPHEDLLFTFEAYYLAEKITYISEVFHRYRLRENSSSSGRINLKRLRAYQRIYIESLRFIDKHPERRTSKSSRQAIRRYLSASLSPIYENYAKLVCDGYMVAQNAGIHGEGAQMWHGDWILMQRFPLLERIFTCDEYRRMKDTENIIVYGAGKYSLQIQQMLSDYGIANYWVCVSKKIRDNKETEISELSGHAEGSIVILAVSDRYRREIKDTAERIGFKNFIDMGR